MRQSKYKYMKFDKVKPKEPWSAEKTQKRIVAVQEEIKAFNRELNDIDSRINELRTSKTIIQVKIGRKAMYLNQLENQLKEQS